MRLGISTALMLAACAALTACGGSDKNTLAPFSAGVPSAREANYVSNRPLVVPAQMTLPEPGGVSRAAGAASGSATALREASTQIN